MDVNMSLEDLENDSAALLDNVTAQDLDAFTHLNDTDDIRNEGLAIVEVAISATIICLAGKCFFFYLKPSSPGCFLSPDLIRPEAC
jgi:hypothetical protein